MFLLLLFFLAIYLLQSLYLVEFPIVCRNGEESRENIHYSLLDSPSTTAAVKMSGGPQAKAPRKLLALGMNIVLKSYFRVKLDQPWQGNLTKDLQNQVPLPL